MPNRKEVEKEEEAQEVIDLKSVQLVKASYHEKVQPSVDELDYNSEGFESGGGSEVAIGTTNSFICFVTFDTKSARFPVKLALPRNH